VTPVVVARVDAGWRRQCRCVSMPSRMNLAGLTPGDTRAPTTWPAWADLSPHLRVLRLAGTENDRVALPACRASDYFRSLSSSSARCAAFLESRRRREPGQHAVEVGDPRPVDLLRIGCDRVQQRDRGLYPMRADRLGPGRGEQLLGLLDGRPVPPAAVLVGVAHEPAVGVRAFWTSSSASRPVVSASPGSSRCSCRASQTPSSHRSARTAGPSPLPRWPSVKTR
jgi:hypothetical protein